MQRLALLVLFLAVTFLVGAGSKKGRLGHSTHSVCAYIDAPSTDEQFESIWRAPFAVTVNEIWCEVDAGTIGVDLNIDDGSPLGINGSDISCAAPTGTTDASFANSANLAADNTLDLDIGTVTTAVRLSVCWRYTAD
jgi:hypothetical protein